MRLSIARFVGPFITLLPVVILAAMGLPRPAASQPKPPAELVGYAVLPADTFAEGPASGQFNGDGSKLAGPRFPAQPVQGFSGVQFGPACGSYQVLSDNGFGAKYNSIDYLLRLYTLNPDPITAGGGTGKVTVTGHIQLRDPAKLVPFFIAREFTEDRLLTGFDFDIESFVVAADGTLWLGDEFGPYLLHFDAAGRLLDAPFPTPNTGEPGLVQSPQNPALLANNPQPGNQAQANLPSSRGFEGLAISPDGLTLYPLLEGTVAGDPAGALRIYQFEVQAQQFVTDTVRLYQLEAPDHAIGDITVLNEAEFLVIERDNNAGEAAQFKKIYQINLDKRDNAGFVSKAEVVDLLNIADPNNLAGFGETFRFPFVTVEGVLVLDAGTIIILNDNNYDSTGGRGADIKDRNELIVLRLTPPLDLAAGVGFPSQWLNQEGCQPEW